MMLVYEDDDNEGDNDQNDQDHDGIKSATFFSSILLSSVSFCTERMARQEWESGAPMSDTEGA